MLPIRALFERRCAKAIEKLRIMFAYQRDHVSDHGASFARGVASRAHAPEAMKNDAGDGVHHRRESGDRKDIAGDFYGPFFGGALDFLDVLGDGASGRRAKCREDRARVSDQQSGKLAVILPGASDGMSRKFRASLR